MRTIRADERWASDIDTGFTLSREQGTCSCLGLRVGRSAEELIIVVVIVNAAAAASSESHSFNRFIVFAFAAANTTALTEYVTER